MRIFEWMQNKLNGSNGKKKPSGSISTTYYMLHEPCKQEFSDWPQSLLAIGTFGNNNLKEDSGGRSNNTVEDSSSFQDCAQEFTLEEVAKLQKELNLLFKGRAEQEENTNDQIKEPLKSDHSSLEHDGKEENESVSEGTNIKIGNFYPNNSLIGRGKDHCLEHSNKRGVSKKSLSFLLKKMFACKSGFLPAALFKDPLSTESRMEKILRAILHKKIYPQGSCSTTPLIKKYQETKPNFQDDDNDGSDNDDDNDDDDYEEEHDSGAENGSKWVKTDSEYIVLEI